MILEWEQYCWNGFIWKCIRLQTAWHVIHKYKHLPKKKKEPSHHLMTAAMMIHWHKRSATWWEMPEQLDTFQWSSLHTWNGTNFTPQWLWHLQRNEMGVWKWRLQVKSLPESLWWCRPRVPASRRSSMPGPRIFSHSRWQPIRPSLLSD